MNVEKGPRFFFQQPMCLVVFAMVQIWPGVCDEGSSSSSDSSGFLVSFCFILYNPF